DEERRKWSLKVFGIDTWDSSLYDLVIHIKCITVDEAVEIIKCALKGHCFQTTSAAQKLLDEMSLAARVEATLVQEIPSVKVEAKDGELFIDLKGALCDDQELMARVKRLVSNVAGFDVKVNCRTRP
ncbi:MAG: cytidylate kinase-like family protein, partial [Desulfobaccales bacterium]